MNLDKLTCVTSTRMPPLRAIRAALIEALAFLLVLSWEGVGMGMPIPEDIKKAVTFVFVRNDKGELVPNGTAFLVGVRGQKNPDALFGYIVTARHVLQQSPGGPYFPEVFLRFNRRDGTMEQARVALDPSTVLTHPTDPHVDIAVVPGLPAGEHVDFKIITEDFILANENDLRGLGASEGSDAFFVGLFLPFFGTQQNYPIVRFGRFAMLTGERIPWRATSGAPVTMRLYLIETQSFGGNSGSPVFLYLGADRTPGSLVVGGVVLKLAGIMMGSFNDVKAIPFVDTAPTPVQVNNVGIAAVVPSHLLHEILFAPASVEARRKEEEKNASAASPVPLPAPGK